MNYKIGKVVKLGLDHPFMKKLLLLFAAIAAFTWSASAQRYQGDVSYAYGIGVGKISYDGWNLQTVHGYRFNDYFFLGGGVGFVKYTNKDNAILPVFANAKGYLGNSHLVNPFVSMDLGYGFRENGGIYFSPALGVNIRMFRRLGVFATVGYQCAKISYVSINNINVRVGFSF